MTEALALLVCIAWPMAGTNEPLRTRASLNGEWQTAEATRLDTPPRGRTWSPATVPGVFGSITGQKRWLRRQIEVPSAWQGRRVWVRYDGVRWHSRHFVNGKPVGRHFEGFSPFALDVTDAIRFGRSNELLVGVCDWQGVFDEPVRIDPKLGWHRVRGAPKDRILSPIGGRYGDYGIWADVELLVVAPVHVRDATIRTSVRRRELTVITVLANDSGGDVGVRLAGRVVESDGVKLPDESVTIKAGQTTSVTSTVSWPAPKLWSYETPHLYHLQLELSRDGRVVDRLEQRFGFREFWCDGPWFYLNGVRLICRASSMWPLGAKTVSDAAERLRRLKAVNVMCFRTHTQPWRQLWYDAADEVGMLMIPEGPVWNDDGTYRVNDERFWQHYAAELRGMVQRMKNNPSVVAWSLENELWGPRMNDQTSGAKASLVELGRKLRRWDPTRPFMYESDGDPDGVADIVGIHYPHQMPAAYLYPNTCYWMDRPIKPIHWFTDGAPTWQWSRRKPLYLGEYLWCPSPTPAAYSVMYGDRAYDDYAYYRTRAIARAWSMQTRAYRAYRVSGLCPWTCAGGSLDVTKDPMAAAQAESMRPLAAFVKEYNTRFYGGRSVRRTLHIMNDTLHAGRVTVTWRFDVGGKTHGQDRITVDMNPADLRVRTIELPTPSVSRRTDARLTIRVRLAGVPDFDETIACNVFPPAALDVVERHKLGLLGADKQTLDRLGALGLDAVPVKDAGAIPSEIGILIVAPDALAKTTEPTTRPVLRIGPPDAAERGIERFLARGGRMLILTQPPGHVRIGAIRFVPRQSTMTFGLWPSHALLRDVPPDDLQFWAPDHIVADAHIDRSACGGRAIVVSGGGQGIGWAALAECRVGRGLVIASGLRLLESVDDEPAAGMILRNALAYMDRWRPVPDPVVVSAHGEDGLLPSMIRRTGLAVDRARCAARDLPADVNAILVAPGVDVQTVTDLVHRVRQQGGVVWWHRPSAETFAAVMDRLELPHRLLPATGPVLLKRDGAMTDGLAQADLYWVAEHPGTKASWDMTPLDPSIVDHEVVVPGRVQLDRARAISADAFEPTGPPVNRRKDGAIWLCTNGSMAGEVDFGSGGPTIIGFRVGGSPAEGVWPRMAVRVGGRLVAHVSVTGREPRIYARVDVIPPGRHRLALSFLNDEQTANEDRNVWISHVYIQPAEDSLGGLTVHAKPAALASLPVGKGRLVVDMIRWDQPDPRHLERAGRFAHSVLVKLGARAGRWPVAAVQAETLEYQRTPHNRSQGDVLILATNGWARVPVACERPGRYMLQIFASGTQAGGEWPLLVVRLDKTELARLRIDSTVIRGHDVPIQVGPTEQMLELAFVNDLCRPPEDRNVRVDRLEIRTTR